MRQIKIKLLAALALFTLTLALPETASAQIPGRTRVPLFAASDTDPFASGHADFDNRQPRNPHFEVEIDDVFSTDSVDVWVTDGNYENWTYVMTIPLAFGMGEVEHEQQRGQFVPAINRGDIVWVFDTYTYNWLLWGQF